METISTAAATQAVIKQVMFEEGLATPELVATMKDKLGMVAQHSPVIDTTASVEGTRIYDVTALRVAVEKVSNSPFLPAYSFYKKFQPKALEVEGDTLAFNVGEFSKDELSYISSVSPKVMKPFLADYETTVEELQAVKAENAALKEALSIFTPNLMESMDGELIARINTIMGKKFL